MPKFLVEATERVTYSKWVEADNPDDAMRKIAKCEIEVDHSDITDGMDFEVDGCWDLDSKEQVDNWYSAK